jgi:hypothetical protein
MADPVAAAAEAVPTAPWPFPRRFLAVYTSPRALFEYLAARPSWFVPLLVVLGLVLAFVLGLYDSVIVPENLAKMEEAGKSSPQAIAFMTGSIGHIVTPAIGVFATAIVMFVYAAFVLMIGGFMLGGTLSYRQAMAIVTHASLIGVLGFAVRIPLALISKTAQVTVGPGMLFPAAQAEGFGGHFLSSFLSSFDLFNLWQTALVALGVSVVARVPSGKANTGIWALFFLGALVGGLVGGIQGR